jgi:hypothetical protein
MPKNFEPEIIRPIAKVREGLLLAPLKTLPFAHYPELGPRRSCDSQDCPSDYCFSDCCPSYHGANKKYNTFI